MVDNLRNLLSKEQVSVNETILEQHSQDESYHQTATPDVVVFPKTTEEVSKVLAYANDNKIPVVPFGRGSSLEGHVIPYDRGITVDFSLMDKIIDIRPEDLLVVVQDRKSTRLNSSH